MVGSNWLNHRSRHCPRAEGVSVNFETFGKKRQKWLEVELLFMILCRWVADSSKTALTLSVLLIGLVKTGMVNRRMGDARTWC